MLLWVTKIALITTQIATTPAGWAWHLFHILAFWYIPYAGILVVLHFLSPL